MPTITLHTGRKVYKGLHPSSRHRLCGAHPIVRAAGTPPASCINSNGTPWNMDGNDTFGDCTDATLGNLLDMVYKCQISAQTVIFWARKHGYLNGANIDDVLTSLETDPMVDATGVARIVGPHASVNYGNTGDVYDAIYNHLALDLGIDAGPLEKAVGDHSGWVLTGITQPITNYDHSVFSPDYGTAGQLAAAYQAAYGVTVNLGGLSPSAPAIGLYTWGTIGIVELESWINMTGEAWAIESFPGITPPGPGPGPAPGGNVYADAMAMAPLIQQLSDLRAKIAAEAPTS